MVSQVSHCQIELIGNTLVCGDEVFSDDGWILFAAWNPEYHPRGGHISNKGKFSKYKKMGDSVIRNTPPEADPAIANLFKRMFAQQKKSVLGYLQMHPKTPKALPSFDFVALNFKSTLQTEIYRHGHDAARQTLATLGVKDMHKFGVAKHQMGIAAQKGADRALQVVNDTTARQMDKVLEEFKKDSVDGKIRGDEKRALINRMRAVFTDATEKRVPLIAEFETAHANRAGESIAAVESGIVARKSWVTVPGACDICKKFEKAGPIPVNGYFGKTSYGYIYHSPAHNNCRCHVRYMKKAA